MQPRREIPTMVAMATNSVTDHGPRSRWCCGAIREYSILSRIGSEALQVKLESWRVSRGSWSTCTRMSGWKEGVGGRQELGDVGRDKQACLSSGGADAWLRFQLKLAGLLLLAGEGLTEGC